jgi:hypothetical protein
LVIAASSAIRSANSSTAWRFTSGTERKNGTRGIAYRVCRVA